MINSVLLVAAFCGMAYGNSPPRFNVSGTVSVSFPEDSSGGTSLYTFNAYDVDGVSPSLSYTYDPTDGSNMFSISETTGSGKVSAVLSLRSDQSFDYETLKEYKITARASDGVSTSPTDVILTVRVTNVNEAPYLNPPTTAQYFVTKEGASGDDIGGPNFTVEDVDDDDNVHTWTITGGTGQSYISISASDGFIRLKKNYDRENAATSENVYVNVTITDDGGLGVDVTYFVTFLDKNDNTPTFSPRVYTFDYNGPNDTDIDDVVTTVTYTDADFSSPNNVVTLSLDTNNELSDYFQLDGMDLVLKYPLDLEYGQGPYTFYVIGTDNGSPARTGTATVIFGIPEATTLAPTTTLIPPQVDSEDGSLSIGVDGWSTGLLLLACIVAAAIIGYVLILSWRLHTFGACLSK